MIRVQIGTDERTGKEITERWINEQVNRRRAAGEPVCVRVSINTSSLNVSLATLACGGGGGGSRMPNPQERSVFDLWEKRGMNDPAFAGGNLVAFLNQVERMI